VELLALFQWMETSSVAVTIQSSTYLFPLIEVGHLFGLTLLYGSLLLVDARLVGVLDRGQALSGVASDVERFTRTGLVLMALTGVPLLMSEALKCYGNPAFWFKMYCLGPALVFHFTVRAHVVRSPGAGRVAQAATGVASFLLWGSVGIGGRAIAFV
jgi:hypothetical protein